MLTVLFSAFGLLLLTIVRAILRAREIRNFKLKHGCQPPVQIEQSERILGLGVYKTQMQAYKEHRVLQVGRERYLKYGNTWSLSLLGMTFVNVSIVDIQGSREPYADIF